MTNTAVHQRIADVDGQLWTVIGLHEACAVPLIQSERLLISSPYIMDLRQVDI